ncbi:uncharacterized protein LOC143459414 [Clavelina lepadiformis]|uniref:uncharacterized protein LOC143459414 n=1 Tax=Clavelina lepadiformis TaxID=159417 RepID=UPI00404107D4
MSSDYNSNKMQQMVASAAMVQHSDVCYPGAASYQQESSFVTPEALLFQPLHPAFTGGIESYLDPKYACDPAAFASRLPYLPFHAAYGMYDYGFEPAFIRKRNERERQRVKCVNEGYARLREHLPEEYAEKRLSKVETLRGAIKYIKQLQNLLGMDLVKERRSGKRVQGKMSEEQIEDEESKMQDEYASASCSDEEVELKASSRTRKFQVQGDDATSASESTGIKEEALSTEDDTGRYSSNQETEENTGGDSYFNSAVTKLPYSAETGISSNCFSHLDPKSSCQYSEAGNSGGMHFLSSKRHLPSNDFISSCRFNAAKSCGGFNVSRLEQRCDIKNSEYRGCTLDKPSRNCNSRYVKSTPENQVSAPTMIQNGHEFLTQPSQFVHSQNTMIPNRLSLQSLQNTDAFYRGSVQGISTSYFNFLRGRPDGDSDGFKSDNSPGSSSSGVSS